MEFDDMKKIWDSQNDEPIYGFNEKALHQRILSKKSKASHITNFSELLLIVTNVLSGGLILGITLYKRSGNVFVYALVAWMLVTALFCVVSRIRRIRSNWQFDRSMLGDLSHAIATSTYQVHLSQLIRWNVVPIGILILLGVWDGGRSIWLAIGIFIFFVVTYYASGWELNYYVGRKRELESLQRKLENEVG